MENMQGLTVNGRCSCIFIGDAQCRFLWEKEIREGDEHMLMCLEAVNICMDDEHLDEMCFGDDYFAEIATKLGFDKGDRAC